jgi:hypothetical protein
MRKLTRYLQFILIGASLFALAGDLRAQMVAFGTEEVYSDSILQLEDLYAQCVDRKDRAIFSYAKNIKLLAWYRSDTYTSEDERQMNELIGGIRLKDTGRPRFDGYVDIRDLPKERQDARSSTIFSRENYQGFFWVNKDRPNYSASDCKNKSSELENKLAAMEKKIPGTFPEIDRYLKMADPDEFLRISKAIGSCAKYSNRNPPVFVDGTRFEAWLSNNFSRAYGRKEKLSRPLLEQLQRELRALGNMASAATGIEFTQQSKAECDGLNAAIASYDAKHPAL